jgi:hypothetical protein
MWQPPDEAECRGRDVRFIDTDAPGPVGFGGNEALHRQAEQERRMQALDEFLSVYETEHAPITDDEIRSASRRARARALVIQGKRAPATSRGKRRRRAGGA